MSKFSYVLCKNANFCKMGKEKVQNKQQKSMKCNFPHIWSKMNTLGWKFQRSTTATITTYDFCVVWVIFKCLIIAVTLEYFLMNNIQGKLAQVPN